MVHTEDERGDRFIDDRRTVNLRMPPGPFQPNPFSKDYRYKLYISSALRTHLRSPRTRGRTRVFHTAARGGVFESGDGVTGSWPWRELRDFYRWISRTVSSRYPVCSVLPSRIAAELDAEEKSRRREWTHFFTLGSKPKAEDTGAFMMKFETSYERAGPDFHFF